jgi:AraC-like DNA-binding protein
MSLPDEPDALAPLVRNCVFRSDVRVDAHDHVSRELIEHQLRWRQGTPDAAMYKGELNQLRMYLLQYGAEVEVTPRPFDDFTLVHTSLVGGAEVEVDGQRLDVTQGRSAVLAPRRHVRLRWYPGTRQMIVKVPHALLRQIVGREDDEDVGFGHSFLVARRHALQWELISRSLVNAMSMRQESGLHEAWLDHFERNVALFLMAHRPGEAPAVPEATAVPAGTHGAAESISPAGGKRRMDAVVDYIDSRLGAPISLEDLARAGGVSLRTLNELCHRHHGVTPMQLLRNRRLDAARQHLRMRPDASITDTAFAFGFGHLGRFSHYYHERFRELPRQTKTDDDA